MKTRHCRRLRRRLLGGHAAVDHQFGPGDEGRLVGGQVQDARRDVFRLTHAAQGRLGNAFLMDVRVVMVGPGHGGVDESGMDRIGPDVLRCVLNGGGLIEDSDRALGGMVSGRSGAADQAMDAGVSCGLLKRTGCSLLSPVSTG